jgi:hypothetical protein
VFLEAFCLASIVILILLLFEIYILFPLIGIVRIIYFPFLAAALMTGEYIAYIAFTSILLSKKKMFSFSDFFTYTHFPMKLINLLASKNKEINRTLLKTGIAIFMIAFLVNFTLIAVFGIIQTDNIYKKMINQKYSSTDSLINEINDRYSKLIELLGYNELQYYTVSKVKNGEIEFYKFRETPKIMFYDCDTKLNCKNMSYNEKEFRSQFKTNDKFAYYFAKFYENEIKVQFENEEDLADYLAKSKEIKSAVFIVPNISKKEYLDLPIFIDEELAKTEVANDLQKYRKKIYLEFMKDKITYPYLLYDKFDKLISGKVFDDMTSYVIEITEFGLSTANFRGNRKDIESTYSFIKKNDLNLTVYIAKLENNIKMLNELDNTLKEIKKEKEPELTFTRLEYGEFIITQYYKYSDIGLMGRELKEKMDKIRMNTINRQRFDKITERDNLLSITIRLKLFENRLANDIRDNKCNTEECINKIMEIVQDPYHCDLYFGSGIKDFNIKNCYLKYAKYNKEICNEFRNHEELKTQCLSS